MSFVRDARLTFDSFVTGAGSQLTAAAARRAAESPGSAYNPLYLYGGTGVGKTHLLHAVGALAQNVRPELAIVFESAEQLTDALTTAVAAGNVEEWRDRYAFAGLVLLDDIQNLAGKVRTQEELLRLWSEMDRGRTQMVITGNHMPAELPDLTDALRARLAGGLSVDIPLPEPAVRREVAARRARQLNVALSPGAVDLFAELPGGLDAVHLSVDLLGERQRSTGRVLSVAEVRDLFDAAPGASAPDEFAAFLSDITSTVELLVEAAPWRRSLAEAIMRWEGEGVRTGRLEEVLETDSAPDVAALTTAFAADVERLRALQTEIAALDAAAAENPLLRDPDRIGEAEALLATLKAQAERQRANPTVRETGPAIDRWFFSREKLAWSWVAMDERLIEEVG